MLELRTVRRGGKEEARGEMMESAPPNSAKQLVMVAFTSVTAVRMGEAVECMESAPPKVPAGAWVRAYGVKGWQEVKFTEEALRTLPSVEMPPPFGAKHEAK